jgi:hypothetical protein
VAAACANNAPLKVNAANTATVCNFIYFSNKKRGCRSA